MICLAMLNVVAGVGSSIGRGCGTSDYCGRRSRIDDNAVAWKRGLVLWK